MLASTVQFSNNHPRTTSTTHQHPPKGAGVGDRRSGNQDHATSTVRCLRTQQRAKTPTHPDPHRGPGTSRDDGRRSTQTTPHTDGAEGGREAGPQPRPRHERRDHHGWWSRLPRKEVIQPHLPVRLPCYDLVLIASPTFDRSLPRGVGPRASGVTDFHDLTGGVYKARERIHRSVADLRLLATPTSRGRVADPDPN